MKKLLFAFILIIMFSCSPSYKTVCYRCYTSVNADIVMVENRCMTDDELSTYVIKTESEVRRANPRIQDIKTVCEIKKQ